MSKLICSGCHQLHKPKKMAAVKKNGTFLCIKCFRKHSVEHRPQGMNWKEAFNNIVKYGTFTPSERKLNQ